MLNYGQIYKKKLVNKNTEILNLSSSGKTCRRACTRQRFDYQTNQNDGRSATLPCFEYKMNKTTAGLTTLPCFF